MAFADSVANLHKAARQPRMQDISDDLLQKMGRPEYAPLVLHCITREYRGVAGMVSPDVVAREDISAYIDHKDLSKIPAERRTLFLRTAGESCRVIQQAENRINVAFNPPERKATVWSAISDVLPGASEDALDVLLLGLAVYDRPQFETLMRDHIEPLVQRFNRMDTSSQVEAQRVEHLMFDIYALAGRHGIDKEQVNMILSEEDEGMRLRMLENASQRRNTIDLLTGTEGDRNTLLSTPRDWSFSRNFGRSHNIEKLSEYITQARGILDHHFGSVRTAIDDSFRDVVRTAGGNEEYFSNVVTLAQQRKREREGTATAEKKPTLEEIEQNVRGAIPKARLDAFNTYLDEAKVNGTSSSAFWSTPMSFADPAHPLHAYDGRMPRDFFDNETHATLEAQQESIVSFLFRLLFSVGHTQDRMRDRAFQRGHI